MPVIADMTLARYEDGLLNITMVPVTNVGGWAVQFTMWKRLQDLGLPYTSGLIIKSAASGFGGGVSGITIVNSGQGQFQINLFTTDLSGTLDAGNYGWKLERIDSGFRGLLAEGYRLME